MGLNRTSHPCIHIEFKRKERNNHLNSLSTYTFDVPKETKSKQKIQDLKKRLKT